jgi:hypothetical protein
MANQILIKRNTLANIGTLTAGELYLATDTLDLYIGSASGNKLVGGIAALLAKVSKAGDTMTGQLISTLATGTSPLAVTSTTVNTNLNADMVDGKHTGTSGNTIPLLDGTNTFSGVETHTESVKIQSDSKKILLGAGDDMSLYYDGTSGYIKTSEVAASDLHITTGADKTLVLDSPAYEDIQFPTEPGKVPAANYPTYENFTSANIEAYAFSVNDKLQLSANEPPHGWDEGTLGYAHVHFCLKTAQTSGANQYVKTELIFAYADYNGVWVEQAAITQEETIPTASAQWKSFLTSFASTVTLTGLHVGSQIKCRVRRIAATGGTEYADDVYISQVGVHVAKVRIGSRTLASA